MVVVVVVGGRRQRCIVPSGREVGCGGGGGRGAKAKVHSTFWVVDGVGVVGGWCVVGGGLGKVGWVVSVWVRSVGLSWAGFVELSSVGWVPESGVRGNLFSSFSFISLIADGPHHYGPACGHKGSSHLFPVHAL